MADNTTSQAQDKIIATFVGDDDRIDILPRFFGRRCVYVENAVYKQLRDISPDYNHGYWDFYLLSNGGFYMAPRTDKRFNISTPNMYDGEVSADAAGIIACLDVWNALAQSADEKMIDLFYQLRDFAKDHEEAGAIFAAID